jgi:predicted nucleotidyltransferase
MPSQDYEEFIAALNEHSVRYLVIGAHAVAFHARPRATKDLDILLDPRPANARRVLAALRDFFGGADLGYTVGDLTDPGWIIQLGVAPVRIDLASQVPGIPIFRAAWGNRVEAQFGYVKAYYLGLDDLIRAKEATGRVQDRADVRTLRRAKDRARLPKRRSRRPGTHG